MNISQNKISRINVFIFFVSFLLIFYFFTIKGFYFTSAFSISFFAFISLKMLNKIGKTLPIKELMVMMLSLQLLLSPLVTYHYFDNITGFPMTINEELYIPFVLFYILSFSIGLFLPVFKKGNKSNQLVILSNVTNARTGLFLILFGYSAYLLSGIVPKSFSFIFYLFSYSRLIGALFLIYSNYKFKYLLLGIVYIHFTINIINAAIFYDLIIWGFFLYMALEVKLKSSFFRKIGFTIIGMVGLMFLQSIKSDYRAKVWDEKTEKKGSNIENFVSVAAGTTNQAKIKKVSNFESLITRLNTGWIISSVMVHTPRKEPFTNGKLLLDDLGSVLLPRFLAPNKKTVGGKENRAKFTKYTGRKLRKGTTMRIGVLADAYINFGFYGGAILMLVFGFLLNFVIHFFNSYFFNTPYYLWLLFIFSFTIRMSDFLVILNSTFKGFIIFLVIKYIIKNFVKTNINSPPKKINAK